MMFKTYWLFNGKLDVLIDENNTDSSYDLIRGTFAPGVEVPPHKHQNYSEAITIVEGELTVYLTGQTITLRFGDHLFIPKDTPHAISNQGQVEAKAITVASPSGLARFIRESGLPANYDGTHPSGENDIALVMQKAKELGDVILGPPGSRL